ncbi:hypothetical protein [Rossellomorea marisflavi]|uniref:hypothetical protein n=1 Tax=Rossellomorea marisflavi TaxID=189381 RepID=UPI003FA17BCA
MNIEGTLTEVTEKLQHFMLTLAPILIGFVFLAIVINLMTYIQRQSMSRALKEKAKEVNKGYSTDNAYDESEDDDEVEVDDFTITQPSTIFENEKADELNNYDALKVEEEGSLGEEAQARTVEEKVIHNILQSEASTDEMKERAESLLPHFATPSQEEIELKNKQDDIELDLRTLERIVDGRIELDKIKAPSK